MRGRFALSLGFLVATLSACESEPIQQICTQIGCANGLRVEFDRAPDPGTVVSLEITGAPLWVVRCGQDADCADGLMFSDLRTTSVRVWIETATDTVVRDVRPVYMEHQPNGPGCPDTCFNATVLVRLP